MQYNTTRELLNIREYGRGVHMMVKHLKTIQDKEHRQRNAEAIIEVMAILSPQQKAIEDYKHKLWDHLFLIAGYDLDVECPYPIPTEEIKMRKPDPLPYPKNKIKWSHLGYKFENLFQKAIAETDEEKRQGYVATLILFMKTAYQNWHKENATEDMLRDELIQMSNGQLVYEPGTKFADVVNTQTIFALILLNKAITSRLEMENDILIIEIMDETMQEIARMAMVWVISFPDLKRKNKATLISFHN
jgi:hypothetical protein